MLEYYVYIARCSDGSYYTGITNDHERRLSEHNSGHDPKAYTYKRRPIKLVYVAQFNDVNDAIAWEKRVKRWSRKKKEALIQKDFDQVSALSKSMYRLRIDAMVRRAHHDIDYVVTKKFNCHPELVEG